MRFHPSHWERTQQQRAEWKKRRQEEAEIDAKLAEAGVIAIRHGPCGQPNRLESLNLMNSHWNYRLVHRVQEGEHSFAIHEVYYTDDKPTSVTENAVPIDGESLDGAKWHLAKMTEAFEKPVLEWDEIGGETEAE